MPFATDHGGLGYGTTERLLVMEALGRRLVLEPYAAAVIVAGSLLRQLADRPQAQTLIAELVAGTTIPVLASQEPHSRYRFEAVASRAVRDGAGFRFSGQKIGVSQGDTADRFLVVARTSGHSGDAQGLSLFDVPASTQGLQRRSYRTQDSRRAADLLFKDAWLPESALLCDEGVALPLLEQASDEGIAALAAEALGAAQAALDLTVDYLQQRRQFGGPIGRFQSLQHRAAEMLVEVEQMRSVAWLASQALEEPDVAERRRLLSAAKVQLSKSGRFVTEQAIQLHGGIGVSEEHAVGHYYRRIVMMEAEWGDSDHHLRRLNRLGGLFRG